MRETPGLEVRGVVVPRITVEMVRFEAFRAAAHLTAAAVAVDHQQAELPPCVTRRGAVRLHVRPVLVRGHEHLASAAVAVHRGQLMRLGGRGRSDGTEGPAHQGASDAGGRRLGWCSQLSSVRPGPFLTYEPQHRQPHTASQAGRDAAPRANEVRQLLVRQAGTLADGG